jgi:hypothetical protein
MVYLNYTTVAYFNHIGPPGCCSACIPELKILLPGLRQPWHAVHEGRKQVLRIALAACNRCRRSGHHLPCEKWVGADPALQVKQEHTSMQCLTRSGTLTCPGTPSGLTLLALQLLLRGPGCSDDRMACMAEMSNWHRQQMAAVLWAAATCLRCARARVQLGWASSASIAEAPPSRGSAARCELPSQGDDR